MLGEELPFMPEDKLEELGAQVETKDAFKPFVVVADERLITAQNSQSSMKFVQTIKEQWEKHHSERM